MSRDRFAKRVVQSLLSTPEVTFVAYIRSIPSPSSQRAWRSLFASILMLELSTFDRLLCLTWPHHVEAPRRIMIICAS
jgi:hypothetical protein